MAQQLTQALDLLIRADNQLLLGFAESTAPTSPVELALSRLRDRVADASLLVEAARTIIVELQTAHAMQPVEATP